MGRRGRGRRGGGRRREEGGAIDLIVNFPDMALEMKAMQMELAGAIRELHMKRREVEEAEAKVAALNKQVEERLRGGEPGASPTPWTPQPLPAGDERLLEDQVGGGGGLTFQFPCLSCGKTFGKWSKLKDHRRRSKPCKVVETLLNLKPLFNVLLCFHLSILKF